MGTFLFFAGVIPQRKIETSCSVEKPPSRLQKVPGTFRAAVAQQEKCQALFAGNLQLFDRAETSPFLAAGFIVLVLTGCEAEGIGSDWKRIEPPLPAPEFTLPQLDAGPVSLSDYRGRVVIMEFWATWCGPCRFSLPSLEVIYKRYRDRGVEVLLLNAGEAAETARKWAGGRFTAPILLDQDQQVGVLYRVRGIPRLFIVDQQGRLVYAHEGYGGGLERNLKLILEALLAEAVPTTHG